MKPTVPERETSMRFGRILDATDRMTEDRLIHLCFYASNEEFDRAMEDYGIKVVRRVTD